MRNNKKRFPSQRVATLSYKSCDGDNTMRYENEVEQILKKYVALSQMQVTDPMKVKYCIMNDDRLLHLVKFLLVKQKKSNSEIELIKLYLTHVDNFMNVLSHMNINMDQLIAKLCFYIKIEHAENKGVIYKQGDKCDKMYLILNGHVAILSSHPLTMKLTPVNYIKYLILLRFYEEKDILSKTIQSNISTYNITETELNNLYLIFKLYKLFKENQIFLHSNNTNIQYSSLGDFLSKEKPLCSFITSKLFSSQTSPFQYLSPLNLPPSSIMSIFSFYESTSSHHLSSKQPLLPSRSLTLRLSSLSLNALSKSPDCIYDSIYTDITTDNDPSLYYASVKEYCARIQGGVLASEDGSDCVVYEYREMERMGKGDVFGEGAVGKGERKMQVSVITVETCFFGTICESEFGTCVRNTQEKIRSMHSKFFLKGTVFKNVNQNVFEMRYYGLFKEKEFNKGDVVLQRHSQHREVHFIHQGEVDIVVECTLMELYNVISTLCVDNPMEGKVKQMVNAYEKFRNYFESKKFVFAIGKYKQSEILGLDNFTIGNGVYLFDCVCSSKHVSTFCLNDKGYNYIVNDSNVKCNIDEYVYIKRQILCEHLCVIINSHMATYENKHNVESDLCKKGKKVNVVSFNTHIQKKIKLKGNIDNGYETPPIEKSCDFPTLKNVNSYRPYYIKFKSTNPLNINDFISEQYKTIHPFHNSKREYNFNTQSICSHSSSNDCFDNKKQQNTIDTNLPLTNTKSCYKTYYANVPSYRNHTSSNFGLINSGKEPVQTHTMLTFSDLSANMPVDVNSFRKTLRTKKVMIVKTRNGNKSVKEKKYRFYENKTTYSNDIYMRMNHTVFNNVLLPYEKSSRNKIPDVIRHAQKRNNGFIDCLCLDKLIERHYEHPFYSNYYNL